MLIAGKPRFPNILLTVLILGVRTSFHHITTQLFQEVDNVRIQVVIKKAWVQALGTIL